MSFPTSPSTGTTYTTASGQTYVYTSNGAWEVSIGAASSTSIVGTMHAFAGSTAPANTLLCYGQAVSRTTYASLFAVIGTTWGTGDGSTTFNVPDMRGRSPFGKDDMGGTGAGRVIASQCGVDGVTLGAVGGSQYTQFHQHMAAGSTGYSSGVPGILDTGFSPAQSYPSGSYAGTRFTDNYGVGQSQNMPPAAVVNWLIVTN